MISGAARRQHPSRMAAADRRRCGGSRRRHSPLVVLARVDDSFGTIGPWTGLAFYAAKDVPCRPLVVGEHFGGTRYRLLQFPLRRELERDRRVGHLHRDRRGGGAIGLLAAVHLTLRGLGLTAQVGRARSRSEHDENAARRS